MIFKFRLLSDESESFLLDIEVPYDMPLIKLHDFIRKTLNYNPCEMASFFMSDVEWEKFQEFTLLDMGTDPDLEIDEELPPPIAMDKLTIGNVVKVRFDRMIYVFDIFTERQLFMELLESKAQETGLEYPRVTDLQGEAPKQFLDE